MMFRHFETGGDGRAPMTPAPRRTDSLDATDRRLLWALRRLVDSLNRMTENIS
jgi:hypothetical protein